MKSLFGLMFIAMLAAQSVALQRGRRLGELDQCSFAGAGDSSDPTCVCAGGINGNDYDDYDYLCCSDKDNTLSAQDQCDGTYGLVGTTGNCGYRQAFASACDSDSKCFSPGFLIADASCTGYDDDCRSEVTCDADNGYIGVISGPAVTCASEGASFELTGCTRPSVDGSNADLVLQAGDGNDWTDAYLVARFSTLDATSSGFVAVDETAQSSWDDAMTQCGGTCDAIVMGNGLCDELGSCSDASDYTVYESGTVDPQDIVPNPDASSDLMIKVSEFRAPHDNGLGSLSFYEPRFNCWERYADSGLVSDGKSKFFKTVIDVSLDVLSAYSARVSSVSDIEGQDFDDISSSGEGGYLFCDGFGFSGCSAEVCALMCESLGEDCLEFAVVDVSAPFGSENFEPADSSQSVMCAFARSTQVDDDTYWTSTFEADFGIQGDYYVRSDVEDCLTLDPSDCSRCIGCIQETAKAKIRYLTPDGQCVGKDDCPSGTTIVTRAQSGFETDSCEYCTISHCSVCTVDCVDDDGGDISQCSFDNCEECEDGWTWNEDTSECEITGCELPGDLGDQIGDSSGASRLACEENLNLDKGSSCDITCADGFYADGTLTYSCSSDGVLTEATAVCVACTDANCKSCNEDTCFVCNDGYAVLSGVCTKVSCPNAAEEAAGTHVEDGGSGCSACAEGSYGDVTWDVDDWNLAGCTLCSEVHEKCLECSDEDTCTLCDGGDGTPGSLYEVDGDGSCTQQELCDIGQTGNTSWDSGNEEWDHTTCVSTTEACPDTSESTPACADCPDGYSGGIEWDFVNQVWDTSPCVLLDCPAVTDIAPNCANCSFGSGGALSWDDVTNTWSGCVTNSFGFSYSGAGSSGYTIDVQSTELRHLVNGQYDTSSGTWTCDPGYGGVGCEERVCPEGLSFLAVDNDAFTASNSDGDATTNDIGRKTTATFSNQHAYRECSGRGLCDRETGMCNCFDGFTGAACRRTSCPNGCSGHGVCVNDDVSLYSSPAHSNLPEALVSDSETHGNAWGAKKFQHCKCDYGWEAADCSRRICPHGDDPETVCDDEIAYDIQQISCSGMSLGDDSWLALTFTDQFNGEFTTYPIRLSDTTASSGGELASSAADAIQIALEALPNFAIPRVEVSSTDTNTETSTTSTGTGTTAVTSVTSSSISVNFQVTFVDSRNSGEQQLMQVVDAPSCSSGVVPKFANIDGALSGGAPMSCSIGRVAQSGSYRERIECSGRGTCNRKNGQCKCFDGYEGISCDMIAQTF